MAHVQRSSSQNPHNQCALQSTQPGPNVEEEERFAEIFKVDQRTCLYRVSCLVSNGNGKCQCFSNTAQLPFKLVMQNTTGDSRSASLETARNPHHCGGKHRIAHLSNICEDGKNRHNTASDKSFSGKIIFQTEDHNEQA